MIQRADNESLKDLTTIILGQNGVIMTLKLDSAETGRKRAWKNKRNILPNFLMFLVARQGE